MSSSTKMTVHPAMGLLLMAIVGSIVFLAVDNRAKITVNGMVNRMLSKKGSNFATLKGHAEFAELPTTTDSFAPLFLQKTSEKTLLSLWLQKYGLTMTGKALKVPKTSGGKKNVKGAEASSSTWIYAQIFAGTECLGTEYGTAGLKANTCLQQDDSSSVMFTCNSPDVSMYVYQSTDCSGDVAASAVVAQTGCQLPTNTPWGYSTDDDSYNDSLQLSCIQGDPVSGPQVGQVHYDVMTMYSTSTCEVDSYYSFEAMTCDTCIPFEAYDGATNVAVMFKYGGDGIYKGIYAKLYSSDKNCYSAKVKTVIPEGCSEGVQWLYYYNTGTYQSAVQKETETAYKSKASYMSKA